MASILVQQAYTLRCFGTDNVRMTTILQWVPNGSNGTGPLAQGHCSQQGYRKPKCGCAQQHVILIVIDIVGMLLVDCWFVISEHAIIVSHDVDHEYHGSQCLEPWRIKILLLLFQWYHWHCIVTFHYQTTLLILNIIFIWLRIQNTNADSSVKRIAPTSALHGMRN